MKTKLVLLLTTTLLLLASCSKTTELDKSKGSKVYKLTDGGNVFYSVGLIDYRTKGMHYKVFQTSAGSITTINATLDSLKVAKLKQNKK